MFSISAIALVCVLDGLRAKKRRFAFRLESARDRLWMAGVNRSTARIHLDRMERDNQPQEKRLAALAGYEQYEAEFLAAQADFDHLVRQSCNR